MKRICLLALLLFFAANSIAQTIIGQHKLKDYSVVDEIYPYGWIEYAGDLYALASRPVIRLSESEFVYLWKPSFGAKKRFLTCFNLLTEVQWETAFTVNRNEEIFHLFHEGDTIFTLGYRFRVNDKSHLIVVRKYDKVKGEFLGEEVIFHQNGRENDLIGFDLSPDSSQLIVFHFEHEKNNKNPRNYLSYPFSDGQLGFRVSNASHLAYVAFDRAMKEIHKGKVELDASFKNKTAVIDCQVGNDGAIYTTVFQEPSTLKIIHFESATSTQSELIYPNFSEPFKDAPYAAHLPIVVGASGKAYAAHADREKLRGKWYTRGFQVVTFDFDQDTVTLVRKAEVGSGLQVQISKSREEASLRPVTVFDQYLIKEIIEMPDESVVLLTQKYESFNVRTAMNPNGLAIPPAYQSLAEEVLLFEFDPTGKPQKAIIIPMRQKASSRIEKICRFYSHHINLETWEMQMITWEDSGERLRQPPRIFYRNINLREGTYSSRQPLYEGKRRNQFYLRAYTLFLNPGVAVLMVLDGDAEKHPQVVSVRLGE